MNFIVFVIISFSSNLGRIRIFQISNVKKATHSK